MNNLQFQSFVNNELPRRISSEVPVSGNLPSGKFLKTTGVGLNVQVVDRVDSGVVHVIEQDQHSFNLLTPVYHDGAKWSPARANQAHTLANYVVVNIIDANTFEIAMSGRYYIPDHGLVPGQYYFTSATTAGALVPDEPVMYSNPVLYVESPSYIHILPYRPSYTMEAIDQNGEPEEDEADYFKQTVIIDGEILYRRKFTLEHRFIPNSQEVSLNGVLLDEGIDYLVQEDIIVFVSTLEIQELDRISVQALKATAYSVFKKSIIDININFILNRQIQLSTKPVENSVTLMHNGLILVETIDYSVSENIITVMPDVILYSTDTLIVRYV